MRITLHNELVVNRSPKTQLTGQLRYSDVMRRWVVTMAQSALITDMNQALKGDESGIDFGNPDSNADFRIRILDGADWLKPAYSNWDD